MSVSVISKSSYALESRSRTCALLTRLPLPRFYGFSFSLFLPSRRCLVWSGVRNRTRFTRSREISSSDIHWIRARGPRERHPNPNLDAAQVALLSNELENIQVSERNSRVRYYERSWLVPPSSPPPPPLSQRRQWPITKDRARAFLRTISRKVGTSLRVSTRPVSF